MLATVLVLASLVLASLGPGRAGTIDFDRQLRKLAETEIAKLTRDPEIISVVKLQNQETGHFTDEKIAALDAQWRAEIGSAARPLVNTVLSSQGSIYLRGIEIASAGLYAEIILMDARGLNVAVSDTTSDFWQGDEDKWRMTFAKASHEPYFGPVVLDQSSQAFQSQVSMTVFDPDTGAPIGAITVGVNVELLD